jgi:hypothetical protein
MRYLLLKIRSDSHAKKNAEKIRRSITTKETEMNNFSVSIKPETINILDHSSGAQTVTIRSGSLDFVHIGFATPYEAWKWHQDVANQLKAQMTGAALLLATEAEGK